MTEGNSHTPQLLYYALGDEVTAFSTTRHGGVGEGNYASFNINTFCGDTETATTANKTLLSSQLHIDDRNIVMPHQTHSTVCMPIDESFLSMQDDSQRLLLDGVDALLTNTRGLCIGVSTADCIPILLYDAVHHASAAIHAGWRGTVQRIAERAVEAMQQHYGSHPRELKAVIGPGISLEAFEVGDEVYTAFSQEGFHMPDIARRFPPMHKSEAKSPSKWHIDLKHCNRLQLETAGLTADNIHDAGICTYYEYNDFFSARRMGTQSGRIFTAILIR